MMETREHTQGGNLHLTEAEARAVCRTASRDEDGLAPSKLILEGVWFKPPTSSVDHGRPGMRAFDSDYFYICVAPDTWRRVPLEDWLT